MKCQAIIGIAIDSLASLFQVWKEHWYSLVNDIAEQLSIHASEAKPMNSQYEWKAQSHICGGFGIKKRDKKR